MWIWTVHMNFSCSFHFSNSLLLLCSSFLKFTAPLFWKFHQQNSERNMFYHFLSTQLVSMSNFNNVFSLRKKSLQFPLPATLPTCFKSVEAGNLLRNPDCNASKTCRSNGGVEWYAFITSNFLMTGFHLLNFNPRKGRLADKIINIYVDHCRPIYIRSLRGYTCHYVSLLVLVVASSLYWLMMHGWVIWKCNHASSLQSNIVGKIHHSC